MIHYHGGVLHVGACDPAEYVGRNWCVSWAYDPENQAAGEAERKRQVVRAHEICQSVMLDNGAFSMWSQGKSVNWPDFYEWAEPWLRYQTTWAVIPDVLGLRGLEEENDQLITDWCAWALEHNLRPDKGVPVFHIWESLERLERLVSSWPMVALGISAKPPANLDQHDADYQRLNKLFTINSPGWRHRMEQVMDVACDEQGYPRTNIHLLRGLKFSAGPYPIYSADSASVASTVFGSRKANMGDKVLWRFYAQFDGKNPPARWERPGERLFDLEPEPELEATAEQLDEGVPFGDQEEPVVMKVDRPKPSSSNAKVMSLLDEQESAQTLGGDPVEVQPPASRAESQAELNGPSGSPTSPPKRDEPPAFAGEEPGE